MRWILCVYLVLPGRSYTDAQQDFLKGRMPWLVVEEGGHQVMVEAKSLTYGHRLAFSRTIIQAGEEKKVTEDIFAVPYKGEIYWLRTYEFVEFEKMGTRTDDKNMVLLLISAFIIYSVLRAIVRMSHRGQRRRH